jgi:hypothetical protein
VPGEEPAPVRRPARRKAEAPPEPEQAAPVATVPLEPEARLPADGADGADGANGAPVYGPEEEPAPVGGDGEAARAERAARKKQRQQRQRSRRKHGRRR